MSAVRRDRPPAPGAIRPAAFPSVERARLENELDVLSARHGDLPLVTAAVILQAGAAGEPSNRPGLAHLTANALQTGTRERSGDQIAWEVERLGVELESDAGWDASAVEITVPRERLEPALALFAEVVRRPTFPEDEIERLRDEQLARILQRAKEPRALASDAAGRYIFGPGVPYARPLIGTGESVAALMREDVERYHREHYVANGSALIMVGDITADDAAALARRHFGDWTTGRLEEPEFDVLPGVDRTTVFIVDRPGAVQSEIRIGHVGVERHHDDYFPLVVMNTLLGGAFTSRLNMSLRERLGFTYGARSGFAFRRRPGPFIVQTAVGTDVTARAVGQAVTEMRALRDDGAGDEEVAAARDYLRGVLPLRMQTTGQLAGRLADLVIYDLPDDYLAHYRERIAAVTTDDVTRVARGHLHVDRLAIVVVGDAASIQPALEELDLGPVEVHHDS